MKTRLGIEIRLSTLFYTVFLSSMLVMPLVLAARYDAALASVAHRQAWERVPHAHANGDARRDLRLPQTDAPPGDKACAPDAAILKPGKARAKTIKL